MSLQIFGTAIYASCSPHTNYFFLACPTRMFGGEAQAGAPPGEDQAAVQAHPLYPRLLSLLLRCKMVRLHWANCRTWGPTSVRLQHLIRLLSPFLPDLRHNERRARYYCKGAAETRKAGGRQLARCERSLSTAPAI